MSNLRRVEIIANNSIEEDIMEGLSQNELATHFTRIANVHGQGDAEPKQGNDIWPEENFILIIYCSEEDAHSIKRIVMDVREKFPDEGIRCFIMGE